MKTSKSDKIRKRLAKLSDAMEMPMVVLAVIWLALLVAELVSQLSPLLTTLGTVIWIIFIVDFLLKLIIADHKGAYIRDNILVLISIAVPALRIFRLGRALSMLRFSRSVRLVRIVTSFSRGMKSLKETLGRGGFYYVLALTIIVILLGAAGIYAFEHDARTANMSSYANAVWWAAMMITTMGSDYWPRTVEGRIMAFLLALYAFTIFGYITAMLATFFIGHRKDDDAAINKLNNEIKQLTKAIAQLTESKNQLEDLQQPRTKQNRG